MIWHKVGWWYQSRPCPGAYTHKRMYIYIRMIHTYIHMHKSVHVCTHMQSACMYAFITRCSYFCIPCNVHHAHIHAHTHIYTQTYIHTYIHTYVYTYISMFSRSGQRGLQVCGPSQVRGTLDAFIWRVMLVSLCIYPCMYTCMNVCMIWYVNMYECMLCMICKQDPRVPSSAGYIHFGYACMHVPCMHAHTLSHQKCPHECIHVHKRKISWHSQSTVTSRRGLQRSLKHEQICPRACITHTCTQNIQYSDTPNPQWHPGVGSEAVRPVPNYEACLHSAFV
jgi:hypothetical protein